MNKIIKLSANIAIIFLMCGFVSAAEQYSEKRSRSAPTLSTSADDITQVKRVASWPQLPEKTSYTQEYERRMAEIKRDTIFQREELARKRKLAHKESESGVFSNIEEVDRDITSFLIFVFSAFNTYQAIQLLTIPELAIGALGLCGSTCLSLNKIHNIDDEHQKKYGKNIGERKQPIPSFWYQTQYVYYGVLGALFCASLMNYLDHSRLAYFLALGSFNAMLSSSLMAFLNLFSITKGDAKAPFTILSPNLNKY